MSKDKESEVKSPPPAAELVALSPSGARTPPLALPREPHTAPEDAAQRAAVVDPGQKKRGRKRKPALESVDPEEAKRIHNLNNKKLRDDQNELFAQLKRMVGIEAQAKKTTVLIRVVEHMQRQEEVIASQRRKLHDYEQCTLKVLSPNEVEVPMDPASREAQLAEQLASAQKVIISMQASHVELKTELERLKNRVKLSKDEKSSPTSAAKTDVTRRLSDKKIPLGTPATILPKHRTVSPAGSTGEDASRDDERKVASMDALVSLTTLALAAESGLRPVPAAASSAGPATIPAAAQVATTGPLLSSALISAPPTTFPPPALPEPEPRSAIHDWLGSADLKLSFWRHGKALRHQPGRAAPADKIASRLYKLPRPLFDCRNSGRDIKHEDSSERSCASPACCRPTEDSNWVMLQCGDRIHKECYIEAGQACYASRSVFFVPPPSVQLWRVGDAVTIAPTNPAKDKLLGCIPCFAKNDAPALAIPYTMLGPLKESIATVERILPHVEVRQGVFKGDTIVEVDSTDVEKDEKDTPTTARVHRSSSPSRASSPASHTTTGEHLYPLVQHLAAISNSALHLCLKQNTSIRHRSHRRDAPEVTRVFRLRFTPPEGPPLLSTWFFLAATSWAGLAECGAKMVPGEHTTGQAVLNALLEAGGGLE